MDSDSDRRAFLIESARFLGTLGAGLAALDGCRKNQGTDPGPADASSALSDGGRAGAMHALLPAQRAALESACHRILPPDQEPGARDANVIEYIDRELAAPEFARLKKNVLAGVVALDRFASRSGNKKFVELSESDQDDVLRQVQHASKRGSDFVKFLVLLTLEGFFGDPMYGGNKDSIGWKLAGYGPGWGHDHH